jgi:hypothetical protein
MPLQKAFLLPPLKGLNLYDNPFTMDPQFAVDLVNFMPPTTTFSVRPGMEFIASLLGQVRGIFSYTTGISEDYGRHWYNSTIKYGAARVLLVKLAQTDGTTHLYSIDPLVVGKIDPQDLGVIENNAYNDDSVLYKHTLFFSSGVASSSMNLYHQEKGLAKFALTIGDDGQTEIGDMQNLTIFKDYIFLSGNNSLNIFFIQAENADILMNTSWWKSVENLFSPHNGSSFTLDGIVQNGGSIIRLLNISRSGLDTVSTYLAAVTDQGEIVLFDGSDPSDTTGEKWQVTGRFQIPPPLNKFCFADMEGDLVVATKNGLVSLRRVIFGQSSQITENLEYRLLSLFSQYMFKMPSMSDFIGLYYHARNRLLIFNVPTDLPMPFNKIMISYNFNENKYIVLPSSDRDGPTEQTVDRITDFVNNYIFVFNVSYTLYIELDGDYTTSNIKVSFIGETSVESGIIVGKCTVDFSINLSDKKTNILNESIVFKKDDMNDPSSPITRVTPLDNILWNTDLKRTKGSDPTSYIFSFIFSKKSDNSDYVVTNIVPVSVSFFDKSSIVTLGNIGVGDNLVIYEKMKSDIHYEDSHFPQYQYKDMSLLYNNLAYFDHGYTNQPPEGMFYYQPERWGLSMHKATVQGMMNDYVWFGKNCPTVPSQGMSFTIYGTLHVDDKIYSFSVLFNWQTFQVSGYEELPGLAGINLPITFSLNDPDGNLILKYKVNTSNSFMIIAQMGSYRPFSDQYSIVNFSEGDYNIIDVFGYPWTLDFSKAKDVHLVWDTTYHPNTDPHEPYSTHLNDSILYVLNNQIDNPTDFQRLWGYLLSNNILFSNLPDKPIKIDMINKSKKISVIDSQILMPNAPAQDYPSVPKVDLPSTITNIDVSAIPLFDNIDIVCNFKSTQYVFDSHFGTWSSFKDINMMKGIEHSNDFYFVIPNNISYDGSTYVVSSSSLCRFNPDKLGDDILPDIPDKGERQDVKSNAISVSYKTVPTFDFGAPNKKFLKKIKIFGTPSAFWQPKPSSDSPYPLTLTPFSDFKIGKPVQFVHAFDSDSISKKVLKKHFPHCKYVRELTFSENKKFWKLYAAEVDMIAQIYLPLIANPCTRFGLEIEIDITEAYVDIYGFEIFFDVSQQML